MIDHRFRLHFYQTQAMMLDKRFKLFVSGVQGGKTTFGCYWIWHTYQQRGGCDMLIVGPTYRMLTQSTMAKFLEITPPGWGRYHEHKGTYETRWGHTFYIRSGLRPESIEGMTVGGAWLDEASLLKADVWPIVQGRIAIQKGPALFTTTPRGQNWLWHDVYKPAKQGHEDFGVVQFRSVDSPWFPNEEARRAKERMRPSVYRQRYGGSFEKLEGLVYPIGDRHEISCEPFDLLKLNWPLWSGIDFGFSNPFAWVFWAYNPKKDRYYICGLYYKARRYIQDHVRNVIALKGKDFLARQQDVFCDPSGVQEMDDLRREVERQARIDYFPVSGAFNSVVPGISDLYALIKADRLRVFDLPELEPWWDEKALYQWEEDANGRFIRERPKKEDDHAMDATRYGYATHLRREEPMVY
jgi:phage terminase large subunit